MSDWRNDIDDLFDAKRAKDEEQAAGLNAAADGVINYFREVVEPALNEIQEQLQKQPQCEVVNSTHTNSEERCGSNFKVACPGMPTFEMNIRADVSPKGVSLVAKQFGYDKGRYSWETELASASNGHGLAQYDSERVKLFVAKEMKQRLSERHG